MRLAGADSSVRTLQSMLVQGLLESSDPNELVFDLACTAFGLRERGPGEHGCVPSSLFPSQTPGVRVEHPCPGGERCWPVGAFQLHLSEETRSKIGFSMDCTVVS